MTALRSALNRYRSRAIYRPGLLIIGLCTGSWAIIFTSVWMVLGEFTAALQFGGIALVVAMFCCVLSGVFAMLNDRRETADDDCSQVKQEEFV